MILLPSAFLLSLLWSVELFKGFVLASTGETQHLRLFHVLHDLIAVGGDDSITVHHYGGETVDLSKPKRVITLSRSFNGSDVSKELLHLKIVNSSILSYCDTSNCWLCDIDKEPNCRGYVVVQENKMKSVECIVTDQYMTVRCVDTSNAAYIVKFRLSDEATSQNPSRPTFRADDMEGNTITRQNLVGGFFWDGFVYFVGSAERIYQPTCKVATEVEECYRDKRENVRVTRVCDKDQTSKLESRIDISLGCQPNEFTTALATHFEESTQTLSVAFSPPSLSSFSVCQFTMEKVRTQFDDTWSICQNVQDTGHCKRRDTTGYRECKITSRNYEKGSYTLCKSYFGRNRPGEVVDTCSLHKYNITTYRRGWLENFEVVPGSQVLSIASNQSPLTTASLTTHSPSKSLFMVTQTRENAPRLDRFISSSNRSLWNVNGVEALQTVLDAPSNKLFYARHNTIEAREVSCRQLYKSCEDLPLHNDGDPLQCAWCVFSNAKAYSVPANVTSACTGQLVFDGCPPSIDQAVPDSDGSIVIYGSNFQKLKDTNIKVCGKGCEIKDRRDGKLVCKPDVMSEGCPIEVTGNLPRTRAFKLVTSTNADTTKVTGRKKDSTTFKAAISVVAIIVLLLIIGLIVYLIRRYKLKKDAAKTIHSTSGGSNVPLNYRTGANKINNEYNMHFSHDGYGQIFNDFAMNHRIDINRLDKWDEDIGKGHYGIVYKGEYTLPNGERMLVACKTFHEDRAGSVAEFLREAKVMSRLNHPRILQFVGVHYDVTNQPLLVTKYMANGDLHRYVKDQNRIITLNQLLNFCLQAAEGMEYLHSRNYIHRDLAARNCMLDEKLNVCLADFGLSRESTNNDSYEMLNSRELPIKLLSLEAMDGHFSFKSDVWAFGNLVWEVTTRGWVPWEGESNAELKQKLEKGQRLEQPEYCPNQIYRQIMLPCWAEARDDRPSFTDIIIDMNKIIQVLRAQEALRMNRNYEMVAPRRN